MKSVMQHSFSQVPRAQIPRSTFNRSHGLKTTFDADYLIPILVDDVIPGDTFNVNVSHFCRLATPLHPIMDNLYIDTFYFFVPYRLLWENWEKFCGAQNDPGDSIDYTIPVVSGTNSNTGEATLWDYFGLPLGPSGAHLDPDDLGGIAAFPFQAYELIYDEWFRDQNLQDNYSGLAPRGDGPFSFSNSTSGSTIVWSPIKRGKRHDYFTSCLPWPQKGDAVDLPLGTSADIYSDGIENDDVVILRGQGSAQGWGMDTGGGAGDHVKLDIGPAGTELNLYADLTNATAATINDLRLAFQTQRLLERDARSGTRYNETLLAHWGVTVPDFRVQRPEFLGGNSTPVNITPVANTSGTATEDQGDLTGFGTSSGTSGFTKSFVEHGVIIGLVNARADITYSQGIERYWSKSTRYDFYYPVLAQIGEQSVLNKEIWADGTANDELVFGYQERYAEYRYKPSRLTGLMRPDAASTLASWHLSEDFATLPTLGDTFIQSNTGTPLDRAIAVPSEPHFIGDFYFNMKCARPLPIHGVPGNLDHF